MIVLPPLFQSQGCSRVYQPPSSWGQEPRVGWDNQWEISRIRFNGGTVYVPYVWPYELWGYSLNLRPYIW